MTNATEVPAKASEEKKPEDTVQVPDGHVGRNLNFKDRLLILIALNAFVTKPDPKTGLSKGNHLEMSRLSRIRKILCAEEVDEYYDMIHESYEIRVGEWAKATNLYRSYKAVKGAVMTEDQFKKMFPDWDLTQEPLKPPYKEPSPTAEDKRGKTRPFFFKPELDLMITTALEQMRWATPDDAHFVAELAEKYGLEE